MDFVEKHLRYLKEIGYHWSLQQLDSPQGPEVTIEGRKILNFCSDDYLGLANDPRVKEAAIDAIRRYGAGVAASRLILGGIPIQAELEERLARLKGSEEALLFGSGYHANLGVIPALSDENSVLFCDERSHPSLLDGCRLAEGKLHLFRHRDVRHLEQLLRENAPRPGGHRLIVSESVFNRDGILFVLPDLLSLAEDYESLLYVDECHSFGVFGDHGEGLISNPPSHVISMSTLGKALGAYGAFVAVSSTLKEYLVNRARTFIFSTTPTPASMGAALMSLKIMETEPERRKRLWENIEFLGSSFLKLVDLSPIFFLVLGSSAVTVQLWSRLMEEGLYLQDVRHPIVPEEMAGLRLAVTASHTPKQLQTLGARLSDLLDNHAKSVIS